MHRLPVELQVHVLGFVNHLPDKVVCTRVCRAWHEAILCESLAWHDFALHVIYVHSSTKESFRYLKIESMVSPVLRRCWRLSKNTRDPDSLESPFVSTAKCCSG